MSEKNFTPVSAQVSEAESLRYIFERLLAGCYFVEPVMVQAVRGKAPNLVVDVLPLVSGRDQTGNQIPGSTLYDIPVWRLQRGNSAVIMNPVVGDIGIIAVCDRDISQIRSSRAESVPASQRTHSKSDAVYLGGVLNTPPSQFVEFTDNAIKIVSPNAVDVTAPDVTINASNGVIMNTPVLKVSGDIIDNAGGQNSTLKNLRENYNDHAHDVSGVETGGSTVHSEKTDKQT
ncbi:phage baseplate protein [Escherichia coli]|nr:phage baseplate protein [Escherichia coli]